MESTSDTPKESNPSTELRDNQFLPQNSNAGDNISMAGDGNLEKVHATDQVAQQVLDGNEVRPTILCIQMTFSTFNSSGDLDRF